MKFKYTIEPFVVNSTVALSIIQDIMKSMIFQLDKKLNYDPKHVISKRKTVARLGTYEHQEDQALAVMANHSYIEQDVNMSNNDQEEDKGSQEQEMVDPIISVITPSKGERTLKRPTPEATNMDIDTTTKKPRVSA